MGVELVRQPTTPNAMSAKPTLPSSALMENSQNVKNLQDGGSLIREDNKVCGNCGYTYGEPNDPLIDDEWCKCIHCTKWCHISCGETRKKAFLCFKCS